MLIGPGRIGVANTSRGSRFGVVMNRVFRRDIGLNDGTVSGMTSH